MLYHKIQSLYLRDPATKHKTFLKGQWAMPEFGLLRDIEWTWTEKVDGTNVRIMWDGERVSFGGRTDNAQLHTGLLEHLRWLAEQAPFAQVFDGPVTLFGEGYGRKIQKSGFLYHFSQRFVLFDVHCGGLWLRREDVVDVGSRLGISVVPIVGTGTLGEAEAFVRSGPASTWGDFPAEGIVMRPSEELQTRQGKRIITKLKVKDFL